MLRKLVRRAHNLDNGEFKGNAIAPRDVVKAVPTIGAGGVGGSGYKFRPGRQEDAHEFLVHLLDAIKDGELKAAGINQRQSGWREKLPVPRLDETTLVHRIFGGYLRSQVQCTSCNYQSNTYDPFMDLALEVSKKSSDSIASAFSEFTRKETLDSKNQWKCSSCKKYICAKKHLTVFRPPLSLCIQLKRFTFGSGGGGFYSGFGAMGRAGSKIAKPIEFPANLKLPLSDGRACEYVLTGIVSHVGGSASSGHYTAYVKKPGPIGGHQWYHMDDSFVEAVSETTVLKQKDAYVLFYCRKEVKLEFPSPKGSMSTIEATEFGQKRSLARSDSMACESGKVNETLPPQDIAREKIPSLSFPNSDDPGQSVRSQKSSMGADGSKIKFPPKSSTPDSPSSSSDSDDSSRPALGLGLEPNASSTRSDTKGDPSLSSSSDSDYKDDQSSSSDSDDEEVVVDSKLNQLSLVDAAIKKSQKDSRRDAPNLRLPSASSKRVDAKVDPLSLSDSGLLGLMDRSFSDSGDDIAADPKLNEPSLVDAAIKKSQKLNRNTLTHLRLPNGCPVSLESESDPLDDYSLTSDTSKGKPLPSPGDEATCQTRLSDDKIPSSESEIESDDSSSCSDEGKSSPSPDSNALSKSLSSTPEVNEHELTEKSQKGKPEKNVVRLDKVSSAKTKVILDRGKAKGKVLVMLGLRMKAKAWKPKTLFSHKNGAEHDLLGSVGVGKWDDDADQDLDSNELQKHRTSVMQQLEKKEKNRKRKMHLDRWDEGLDAGKTKKVKLLKDEATAVDPKKNHFHRIQSSIQRMQRGRAKGIFRQSDAANKVNKGAHRRKGSVR